MKPSTNQVGRVDHFVGADSLGLKAVSAEDGTASDVIRIAVRSDEKHVAVNQPEFLKLTLGDGNRLEVIQVDDASNDVGDAKRYIAAVP